MILGLLDRLLGRHISREVSATKHRVDLMTERVEHLVAANQRLQRERDDAIRVSERRLNKWMETASADGFAHASAIAKLKDCGLGAQNRGCGGKCLACLERNHDGWIERARAAESALSQKESAFRMYAETWQRELGEAAHRYAHKHHIDAMVLGTRWLADRSTRFEVTHRLLKEARAQLAAIPPNPEGALLTLRKATE